MTDTTARNSKSKPGETDLAINSLTPLIMAADLYFDTNDGGYMAPDVPIQLAGKSNGMVSLPQKKPRGCVKQNDATEEKRYRGQSLTNPNMVPLTNSLSQDESYENDPNSYLTPKEPPSYERTFEYNDLPVSEVDSDHEVTDVKRSHVPFKRFDSGVEDCVTDRGSNSTTLSNSLSESYHFMARPQLSTAPEEHYEDIDMYSKNKASAYQQKARSIIDKFSMNNGAAGNMNTRPLPQVDSSATRSQSDGEDHQSILETSLAETVSHHLTQPELHHNSHVMTLPHTYSQLMSHTNGYTLKEMSQETPGSHCMFIIAIVVIFIISATALSFSIYILINSSSTSVPLEHLSHPEDFKQILSNLQQEIELLKEENKALKGKMAAQINNTWYLEQEVGYLSSQQSTIHDKMEIMMLNFSKEIANISLTPGPQGQPGVVNFSKCRNYKNSTLALGSDTLDIKTEYLPQAEHVKDNFVIFAYCGYTPGTRGMLEMSLNSSQYRCICHGRVKDKLYSECTIFIWMCPK